MKANHAFFVGFVLAGCATATAARPEFTYLQRDALPAPADARLIEVGEVLNKVYPQAMVGWLDSGRDCLQQWGIQWESKIDEAVSHVVRLVNRAHSQSLVIAVVEEAVNANADRIELLAAEQEVSSVLRDGLQKAGYRLPGGSGARADGTADTRPPLILRPTLINLALSACANSKGLTGWDSVTIEWELYDPNTKSAVFTTTTGGTARSRGGSSYVESYAAALRNLLAEPGFTMGARSSLPPSRDAVYPVLSLMVATVAPDPARAPQLLKHASRAVVRIVKGGEEGSGVIVSAAGQVLTAAHLLSGPSGPVEVELANGQRVPGTVLRTSSAADVALIELPHGTYPVMPIGAPSELRTRGEVLAIAPPVRVKRDRRVTKGVITVLRTGGARALIQSDVIMQSDSSGGPLLDEHGRLIGIAIGRVGAGQNTFLGIEDTWRALQIQPQVATTDADALAAP